MLIGRVTFGPAGAASAKLAGSFLERAVMAKAQRAASSPAKARRGARPSAAPAPIAQAAPKPLDPRGTGRTKAERAAIPVGGIKVRATMVGYYDDKRRRVDDVFTIQKESEFSKRWMVRVDQDTPEKTTTGKEDLRRIHDEIITGSRQEGIQTGPDDVPADLAQGIDNPLGE